MVYRAKYRIRCVGALGEEGSSWTDGMTVSAPAVEGKATTTDLVGSLPNQTAPMGVPERLASPGARLLGFECLDGPGPESEVQKPSVR